MTANDTLIEGITRSDAHPALLDPSTGDVVTYAQLADAVHRIASQLAGTGVGPGDVVLIASVAALGFGALALLWRPLLRIVIHEEMAAVEGVPVLAVRIGFMVLLAVVVARPTFD